MQSNSARAMPYALLTAAVTLCDTHHAQAAASVWVIDDGEKIRGDATCTPFERGVQNPVWRPGNPVRLFAMRNESVAFQVVVEASERPLGEVTVSLPQLQGPNGATMAEGSAPRPDGPQRPIERFVEHFVRVRRASGGRNPGESLGWEKGSGPSSETWVGPVPDALLPVEAAERARPWGGYPMRVEQGKNGIVWIDVNVPREQPPGTYRGMLEVRSAAGPLASVLVELDVVRATLPDRTVGTMLYYDPEELERRVGEGAEQHLWKLLHAHRITPMHDATGPEDVARQREALDGTLYTRAHDYVGPATGTGDGLLALGAYGALGAPNPDALARVGAITSALADAKLTESTFVFLYAADEQCESPWGTAWRRLLDNAADANVRRVRVGWTCSDDPRSQPVDIPILPSAYDVGLARSARDRGKETWVYNGVSPHAGPFLLDSDAVSPRVNGWLAVMFDVPRWFYWESTYWYGRHGKEPIDPFVEPETFQNNEGDWANGDGVLLYPGRQRDRFTEHSLGFDGVIASIRLKNWRRGIEDAGYLKLARARDRARADAVARTLIPAAFNGVRAGAPRWPARGYAFYEARRALLAIALEAPTDSL